MSTPKVKFLVDGHELDKAKVITINACFENNQVLEYRYTRTHVSTQTKNSEKILKEHGEVPFDIHKDVWFGLTQADQTDYKAKYEEQLKLNKELNAECEEISLVATEYKKLAENFTYRMSLLACSQTMWRSLFLGGLAVLVMGPLLNHFWNRIWL